MEIRFAMRKSRCGVKNISRQYVRLLWLCMALFVVCLPNISMAAEEEEKDTYAGVDLNVIAMDVDGETYMPTNLRAKLGLVMFPDLIPVLSFETHFGFSLTDDTATLDGNDATLWVGNYVGFYARASHEVEDIVNLYGLLGLSSAQLKGDTGPLDHDTASGLSLGVGASFGLPFNLDGNVEIMQLVNGDSFNIFMLSFGVSYKL